MRIQVVENADELGRVGADIAAEVIAATPTASVVVATGRTPMGLYAELAARRRSGVLDSTAISTVQLDEYLGLEPDDRRSLFGWMDRSFVEPLGVNDARVIRLPLGDDLEEACAAFDRGLEARGPLDLAILGLGRNGHLGFNEPPSHPESSTRMVELSPSTIEANARYWGNGAGLPATAVTLGMRHLLSARTIVLVVSGTSKRTIVHRAIEGPVGPAVPASFLQEAANKVTVIVDRAAWADR
jgi:glucosamine-6-phosphate deaminase